MEKQKFYFPVRFNAETLRDAERAFVRLVPDDQKPVREHRSVTFGRETWKFDTPEEFYVEYRRKPSEVNLSLYTVTTSHSFHFQSKGTKAIASAEAPTRAEIESVLSFFDSAEPSATVPKEKTDPKLFIGHGKSTAWRDLKDHLQDKHGLKIIAYETGARAGHTIRDVLEDMLKESSFALLVLTAEDEAVDGSLRARQNVIHEVGLFQGRFGFARAIVLLEDGTDEFSNIHGVQQIRFATGRIRETFGEVLATVRREFGAVV